MLTSSVDDTSAVPADTAGLTVRHDAAAPVAAVEVVARTVLRGAGPPARALPA